MVHTWQVALTCPSLMEALSWTGDASHGVEREATVAPRLLSTSRTFRLEEMTSGLWCGVRFVINLVASF